MNTLIDFLQKTVQTFPKKPALIFDQEVFTYEKLYSSIQSLILSLSEIPQKTVVGICIENSPEFVISYLGVMNAGLIPHLIPINLSNEKIFEQLKNSNPKLIICSNKLIKKINSIQFNCKKITFLDLFNSKKLNNIKNIESNNIGYLIYTSGTISVPKGVGITHSNYIFTTKNIIQKLNYVESDVNLIALPLSHSFGLGCLHVSLFLGSTVILVENTSDIELLLDLTTKNNATTIAAVPITLNKIIQKKNLNLEEKLKNIRLIITNSTSISVETVKAYQDILQNGKLATYYGLTEASRSTFMIFNITGKEKSVGVPPDGIQIKIDNNVKNELETGEIMIKGKNVIDKYWNNRDADKLIVNSWLRTGDLGHKDSDGYLYLDGRSDYLINIAGEKVMPEEIERVVKVLTGIKEVVAIGETNEMFGQVIKLFIQKTANSKLKKSDVLTHCIANLERFEVPRVIEFVDDFPRNEFGKIERFKL